MKKSLEKIIDGTKRVVKGVALTGLGLLMYGRAARADFFDGCRIPDKYNVQIDTRYGGDKFMLIPKGFGKKVYGFAATNLSADKIRPYVGVGYIGKAKLGEKNSLHFMPTLEFDTGSKKFYFTNYATLLLNKGKFNIDNVTSIDPDGKPNGSVSAGVDIYAGLRIGAVVSYDGKPALRIWTNNKDVNWIAGATVSKDGIQGNLRVHF